MADLVKVEQGACPECSNTCETADGLEHYKCGAGHPEVSFVLVDTYAMDARKAWSD